MESFNTFKAQYAHDCITRKLIFRLKTYVLLHNDYMYPVQSFRSFLCSEGLKKQQTYICQKSRLHTVIYRICLSFEINDYYYYTLFHPSIPTFAFIIIRMSVWIHKSNRIFNQILIKLSPFTRPCLKTSQALGLNSRSQVTFP